MSEAIKLAVAEKLAHLQHNEWLLRRAKPNAAKTARALEILDRDTGNLPVAGDELPEGYSSIRETVEYKKTVRG